MKTAYERWTEAQNSYEYWSELARLDYAIELNEKMEEQNISRSNLAEKISVSKAYISKILGGYANFTIDSMSKLAFTLGYKIKVTFDAIDDAKNISQDSWKSVSHDKPLPQLTPWDDDLSQKMSIPRHMDTGDDVQNMEKVAA